jgi:asparagine synthetase A
MVNQIRVLLTFWEAKQLEYWLKDNDERLVVRPLYDTWTAPDESEWYAIEGEISVDMECLLQLKYGDRIKASNAGIRYG